MDIFASHTTILDWIGLGLMSGLYALAERNVSNCSNWSLIKRKKRFSTMSLLGKYLTPD